MPKKVYTWGKVRAGDIISFRYKGKKQAGLLTTLLVLNPKLPYVKKDSTTTYHLTGLKLESVGIRPTIRDKEDLLNLLETAGEVKVRDSLNEIYFVDIPGAEPGDKGTNRAFYQKIKRYSNKYNIYRTYDWTEAKKSVVYLEPIKLPKHFKQFVQKTFKKSILGELEQYVKIDVPELKVTKTRKR